MQRSQRKSLAFYCAIHFLLYKILGKNLNAVIIYARENIQFIAVTRINSLWPFEVQDLIGCKIFKYAVRILL